MILSNGIIDNTFQQGFYLSFKNEKNADEDEHFHLFYLTILTGENGFTQFSARID